MIRSRLMVVSLLLVVGAVWTPSVNAQVGGYYPSRGPISPWMNMWIRKPGPLDNYHTYVQPAMQLQRTIGQQNNALMQNALGIQSLGQQMDGQVRPTGTGSVFMEYSHYYPMKGGHAMARPQSTSHGAASTSHVATPSVGARPSR